MEKLTEDLKKTSSLNKRKRLIENYITPNKKSELLDFILFAKPHILDKNDKLRASYQKKYLENYLILKLVSIFFGILDLI